MNEFQTLIDNLEPIVRQRQARRAAISVERDRRLAQQAWEADMARLHHRIRHGGRQFAKAMSASRQEFGKLTADLQIRAAAVTTQRESDQREARAAKLKEILAAVDKGIADGSLTAEQVAILENKIHAVARRTGVAA